MKIYIILDTVTDDLYLMEKENALIYKLQNNGAFIIPVDIAIEVIEAISYDIKNVNKYLYTIKPPDDAMNALSKGRLSYSMKRKLYNFLYFCFVSNGRQRSIIKSRYPSLWEEMYEVISRN